MNQDNHIYLMPMADGEYDLYIVPYAEDDSEEEKITRIDKMARDLLASEKPTARAVGKNLTQFLQEDSIVRAGMDERETVIHFPEGLDPYLAWARFEDLVTTRKAENRIELYSTAALGGLSVLFGDVAFIPFFGVYAARNRRRKKAYDNLLKVEPNACVPDKTLGGVLEALLVGQRNPDSLAEICVQGEDQDLAEFYRTLNL